MVITHNTLISGPPLLVLAKQGREWGVHWIFSTVRAGHSPALLAKHHFLANFKRQHRLTRTARLWQLWRPLLVTYSAPLPWYRCLFVLLGQQELSRQRRPAVSLLADCSASGRPPPRVRHSQAFLRVKPERGLPRTGAGRARQEGTSQGWCPSLAWNWSGLAGAGGGYDSNETEGIDVWCWWGN